MTWQTHDSAHVAAPLKTISNAAPELQTQIEHVIDLLEDSCEFLFEDLIKNK